MGLFDKLRKAEEQGPSALRPAAAADFDACSRPCTVASSAAGWLILLNRSPIVVRSRSAWILAHGRRRFRRPRPRVRPEVRSSAASCCRPRRGPILARRRRVD